MHPTDYRLLGALAVMLAVFFLGIGIGEMILVNLMLILITVWLYFIMYVSWKEKGKRLL